jgi:hypothetical protein
MCLVKIIFKIGNYMQVVALGIPLLFSILVSVTLVQRCEAIST